MGLITNTFNTYSKWTALQFIDLFNIPFVDATKTDGLKWHLQEIRQKTHDAILALETKIETNENNITLNQTNIAGNSAAINTLAQEANGVEVRVTTAEENITSNLNKIESLNVVSNHYIQKNEDNSAFNYLRVTFTRIGNAVFYSGCVQIEPTAIGNVSSTPVIPSIYRPVSNSAGSAVDIAVAPPSFSGNTSYITNDGCIMISNGSATGKFNFYISGSYVL